MKRQFKENYISKPKEQKKQSKTDLAIRLISSAFIIFIVISLIALGQSYILLLHILISILLFREIIGLLKIKVQSNNQPINVSTKISWYIYISSVLFFLISYFKDIQNFLYDSYGYDFQKYKKFTAFVIAIIGFVSFVFTLRKKYVKQQINLFFVTILTIVFIQILLSSVTVYYYGLIWFFMGAFNVAINDSGAYFVGKLLGKTPLYRLSPKKTVEGFIGGLVFTIILGFAILKLFELDVFKPMFCRQLKLTFVPFDYPDCELLPLYVKRKIWFRGLSHIFGYFYISEFQVHMFIFMLFASLIAPFGGFFASGLKRALQIKDFSNLIPGHGGVLDRLDCQFFMLIFASVYISEIVKGRSHSISSVQNYLAELSIQDQRQILAYLQNMLNNQFNNGNLRSGGNLIKNQRQKISRRIYHMQQQR